MSTRRGLRVLPRSGQLFCSACEACNWLKMSARSESELADWPWSASTTTDDHLYVSSLENHSPRKDRHWHMDKQLLASASPEDSITRRPHIAPLDLAPCCTSLDCHPRNMLLRLQHKFCHSPWLRGFLPIFNTHRYIHPFHRLHPCAQRP